jgi:DNA polymerase-3 subunit gamma/tau
LGSAEEKLGLAARADSFSEQDLIRFFDMLLRLENELRWTSQPRFHLEVGLVKLAKVGHVREIEEVLREMKGAGSPLPANRGPQMPPPGGMPAPPKRQEFTEEKTPAPEEQMPAPLQAPGAMTFADIFLRRVEDKSATTAVYLQKAERITRSENRVDIVMTNATPLAMLQSKEHKAVLDAIAGELVGKPVSVSLIMKEQQLKTEGPADNVKDEPLVKKFLEVFRGDIAQIKPAKGE